jgi:hypothetical protein
MAINLEEIKKVSPRGLEPRTLRVIEWYKGTPIAKTAGVKCHAKHCKQSELRETPHGLWCFDHYVDGKICKTEGCHYPAIELGLCVECLRGEQ